MPLNPRLLWLQASGRLVKPGDSVTFTQRFYSTLPDTFQNSFRMNVGQMPEDAIIADRAYNVAQAANAHGGCADICTKLPPSEIAEYCSTAQLLAVPLLSWRRTADAPSINEWYSVSSPSST